MASLFRRPNTFMNNPAFMLAARSAHVYPNKRHRNLKYKSMAREKRKEKRRGALGGIPTPKETGEEIPPFFLPPRQKLFYSLLTDM